MIKEYEVLYSSEFSSGWEYLGKVRICDIQKMMMLKGPQCQVFHICVSCSLSKEEKREIASRHGI